MTNYLDHVIVQKSEYNVDYNKSAGFMLCVPCNQTNDYLVSPQDEDLQYTSLRHEAEPTASTATSASTLDNVTYAKVTVRTSKQKNTQNNEFISQYLHLEPVIHST